MKNKDIGIIVPIYKNDLSQFEKISLEQLGKMMSDYLIIFCAPEGFREDGLYHRISSRVERFNEGFFSGIDGYNRLMMSKEFYDRFDNFEYILIYQLDAFVFKDDLLRFIKMNYDYIGAPWRYPFGRYKVADRLICGNVGNGGLSLRKVSTFSMLCQNYQSEIDMWEENEDSFWDYCARFLEKDFRIAPISVARQFSFEDLPDRWYLQNGKKLPFGCHAWMKKSRDFYFDLFNGLGIKLDSLFEEMGNSDVEIEVNFEEYIGYTFLNKQKYRHIGLPKDKSKKIVIWGNFGDTKDYIDYLLENDYCVEAVYEKPREITDTVYYRDIPLIMGRPILYDGIFIIVGTIWDEDEDVRFLSDEGLVYGRDFISFKREIIEKWKRMMWDTDGKDNGNECI